MIVIVEKNKDNKFEFTKKELEELLSKARQDGYDEGYKLGVAHGEKHVTYPTSPTQPNTTPFWESPFKYDKFGIDGAEGSGHNPEIGKTIINA